MHSIETLRSKSNSCLQVLRVYRSFNVYKAASNEANDIKSTHIECLYNDPLIANCEFNFKADSTPWFVLFFDRDSTAWIACCKHESIESENSRQANQQNENCIGIVLNFVPENIFAENEILIGLLSSKHAQKMANILVYRHVSHSVFPQCIFLAVFQLRKKKLSRYTKHNH